MTHTRTALLVSTLLLILSAPALARAYSGCDERWWYDAYPLSIGKVDVPTDIRPWARLGCGLFNGYEDCTLEYVTTSVPGMPELTRVPVEVVRLTPDTCDQDGDFAKIGSIVEFVLPTPLRLGTMYTLDCRIGNVRHTFTTGTDSAARPRKISVQEARISRGDSEEGCCGGGDWLSLELGGLNAVYLREGGRIEVVYPNGEVFPILENRPLPLTEGPLEITAVAADGTRGETLHLTTIGEREAVYIPCALAAGSSSRAWWLLLPLCWIAARRRPARSR